ncbi:MAG: alcohol dehydrogenase, partial [Bdellovibrio sp.]
EGADQIEPPMPPLICIPTTGGTAADVSQFCVVMDLNEQRKFSIASKAVVPDVTLVDPETLTTMDPYLSACTGVDALIHGIEAFVSKGHSELSDLCALSSLVHLTENLKASIDNPDDLERKTKVMLGAMEAGLPFSNASLGITHAMAHSLGGMFDWTHGECVASVFETVIDFNFPSKPERYIAIGERIGLALGGMTEKEKKERVVNRLKELFAGLGLLERLEGAHVNSSDFPHLTERALEDVCILTNPRSAGFRDIEVLYEASF